MASWVIINGSCLPEDEAVISVTDRGFLFGDGVFTTIRVTDGQPEFYNEHLEKLSRHCRAIGIKPPQIDRHSVEDLIQRNQALTGIWRLKIIVTGGSGRHLDLREREAGYVVISLHPYIPSSSKEIKLTVILQEVSGLLSSIKSLAYLERLWIKQKALDNGFDDAIVISPEGFILETAFSNLFWTVDNHFYYPDPSLPYQCGVTLSLALKKAEKQGILIHPVKAKIEDIPSDASVYICNSMMGIVAATVVSSQ